MRASDEWQWCTGRKDLRLRRTWWSMKRSIRELVPPAMPGDSRGVERKIRWSPAKPGGPRVSKIGRCDSPVVRECPRLVVVVTTSADGTR
jgi:hypothetical protein